MVGVSEFSPCSVMVMGSCALFTGIGEEVPANCSLPQHEGDPYQEERADQGHQKTIAEVRVHLQERPSSVPYFQKYNQKIGNSSNQILHHLL